MQTLHLIPPSQILRPVDLDGSDMLLLTDSIERNGLLVPVTVVGRTIVDGYRRWLVFRAKGWDEIPTHEVSGDPVQLRIIAQTRHAEFGRTDKKSLVGNLLASDRTLTANRIAHDLQWHPAEVESLAGVQYLIQPFRVMYASGTISLADVWHVSRCRDGGQDILFADDSGEPLYERAAALHRETRSLRRRSMTTRARGKGLNAVIRERDKPREAGPELLRVNAKTPMDGWRACLNWILESGK
jgi:hypothetical protein